MRMRSSKMRVFSFDRYRIPYDVPHKLYNRNLHGFAQFPGDSTALVLYDVGMACCIHVTFTEIYTLLFVTFVLMFISGQGEVTWSTPAEALLSSGRGTSFLPLNQSKHLQYGQQQQLMSAVQLHGPTSVCTAAFFRPVSNVHYVQSNQLKDTFAAADPAQMDAGFAGIHRSSAFVSSTRSQILDATENVDHSLSAVSLRSQRSNVRPDYINSYSPLSGTTPAVYEAASGVQGIGHLPAHGWGSAAIVGPAYHHNTSASWQNIRQQDEIELTATAGSVYSVAAPQTGSFSALQTSMQYSAVPSIDSPIASSTSAIRSPVNSPYANKTYTDASGNEGSHVALNVQQQRYLENLLQLHYLLLASNKLQAPRYPPSLGTHHFDSYIPGSVTSPTRPAVFDVNRLPLSPGSLQHGYTQARFPRLAGKFNIFIAG